MRSSRITYRFPNKASLAMGPEKDSRFGAEEEEDIATYLEAREPQHLLRENVDVMVPPITNVGGLSALVPL